MAQVYKHGYLPVSMYGNVVSLLREQLPTSGVHLDIGCGYGAIAEPVRSELRLDYVGFDGALDGVSSLQQRGYEAHVLDFLDIARAEETIRTALRARAVASISILDVLEHVTNGAEILAMLARIAAPTAAPLIISVPNVAHKDIALKLLVGRWDVTEAGLLDHTHVAIFNELQLQRLTISTGWREVAKNDWLLEHSDQQFPIEAAYHNPALPIGSFLRRLIERANPGLLINQFVRCYRHDMASLPQPFADRATVDRRFLSVVINMAEYSEEGLQDLVDALSNQASENFVLIMGAMSSEVDRTMYEKLREYAPTQMKNRMFLNASVSKDWRSRLNEISLTASTHYVVFLGSNENVDNRWISTFLDLFSQSPGSVLISARTISEEPTTSSAGSDRRVLTHGNLSLIDLLCATPDNWSAIGNVAFPSTVFRDLGLRFDLGLGAAAYLDLTIQAAMYCGVVPSVVATVHTRRQAVSGYSDSDGPEIRNSLKQRVSQYPLLLSQSSIEELRSIAAVVRSAREFTTNLPEGIFAEFPLLRSFVEGYFEIGTTPRRRLEGSYKTRPFLSVIIRTRGTRILTLRDALLSLAGQSLQDFNIVVVLHKAERRNAESVAELIDEFPPSFREKIETVECTRAGRAAPLNTGLENASGRYIAFLDDDDFVFGHWVQTFLALSEKAPKSILRASCVRQDYELVDNQEGKRVPRAQSWYITEWPSEYDAVAHIFDNYTPFMSFAFPDSLFSTLGLRFDEGANTAEDWDLTTRMAMLSGVESTSEVTSVYRWWTNGESSRFEHSQDDWTRNAERSLSKFNSHPILLPAGSVAHLREQTRQRDELYQERDWLLQDRSRLFNELRSALWCATIGAPLPVGASALPEFEIDQTLCDTARASLSALISSSSWRYTRWLRRIVAVVRRRTYRELTQTTLPVGFAQCFMLIQEVRQSASWRLTEPVRIVVAALKRSRRLF